MNPIENDSSDNKAGEINDVVPTNLENCSTKKKDNTMETNQNNTPPSGSDVPESSDLISSLALPSDVIEKKAISGDSNNDMFNLENLRISQDFIEQANVETIHSTITVRKPNKHEFFRVRSGKEWQILVAAIEDSNDRELWAVERKLAETIREEVSFVLLRLAVNRNGVPFLWPLKISRNGKSNPWNMSAMVAAERAETKWVRMVSDLSAGRYEIKASKNDHGEPEWPDLPFQKIIELAFKDRTITDCIHPVLQQLRGEI